MKDYFLSNIVGCSYIRRNKHSVLFTVKPRMNKFIKTEILFNRLIMELSIEKIIELNNKHTFTSHDLVKVLTDLASQKFSKENLQKVFDEIAITLLRQTKIVTPENQYYFREIEIYFYDEELHQDTYAHKNKRQLKFGEWYFHRFTDLEPFLKSNRNGVDITFGNEQKGIYGGVLIRKIQNIETNDMIVGINKIARELINNIAKDPISNIGKEKVNNIALNCGNFAFEKNQILHLEVENNKITMPILKTQRNGLTFKNEEKADLFYKAPYCYYNHDINVSKIIEVRPAL